MGLFNFNTVEKGMQLLIKDNGNLLFRPLEIEDASLLEKKNGEIARGWRHYHRLLYPFEGYRNIPSTAVTISHERDIVFDPHKVLEAGEKPETLGVNEGFNRRGIQEIARAKCYRHEHQKPPATMLDRITLGLLAIAVLWGVAVAWMVVR